MWCTPPVGHFQKLLVPDIGLLTMTEVLMHLRYIVEATALPVIGDCDTGYGNALNVMRARAGV